MFAMSYHGADKVVPTYNVMGPVKAALEACVPLPRLRTRPAKDPRARDLARAAEDARRLRAQGLRPAAQRGRAARRSANWWTSWTWASPAPTSPRPMRGACRAKRSTSTAASTSWPETLAHLAPPGATTPWSRYEEKFPQPTERVSAQAFAQVGALLALVASAFVAPVSAQAPAAPVAATAAPAANAMDDLVGRIALYPDDLVAVILPASTSPLQIVQADRWLDKRKPTPSWRSTTSGTTR